MLISVNESTTIRVSKTARELLESLRKKMNAKSLDEAIRLLISRERKMKVDEVFGLDRGRIRPFSGEDRGEDRS